jgi:protein involved in polysaccharide export with SLBB domain
LALGWSIAGCRAPEEKRVFQYLNQSGFGQRAQGNANQQNYLVVGDTVTITDSIHTELKLPAQEVDVDGTINLPELGQLYVLGKTRRELEADLTSLYAPLYERTDIRVNISSGVSTTGGGKKYFILGEVQKPGRQAFAGDRTIFEAVYLATPIDQTANLARIQLVRGDPVDPLIITVNFHDIIDYGDTTYNVIVHENDIIYVPPTLFGSIGHLIKQLIYPIQVVVDALQGVFLWFSLFYRQNQFYN